MNNIAEKLQAILGAKADIKDAIEAKGVTVGDATLAEYASKIGEIQQGGGHVPSLDDDVRFFDYEGTLLYSYSKEDFAQLTELPANPSHEGLTAQGWNWTLADAKSYVHDYGRLTIGQSYITDDGKTRFYISLENEESLSFYVTVAQTVSNGVVVDWGDGSSTESMSGTGNKIFSHVYSQKGTYCVTFEVVSGTLKVAIPNPQIHKIKVRNIELGESYVGLYFRDYYGLETITIPINITELESNTNYNFYCCYALRAIIFPVNFTGNLPDYMFNMCKRITTASLSKGITGFSQYCFYLCLNLHELNIPRGVTSLPNSFASQDRTLKHITVPDSVVSIGNSAFSYTQIKSIDYNSAITFGNTCFQDTSITSIVIRNSLGNSDFVSCSFLKEVKVESPIIAIPSQSFNNCSVLQSVSLLEGLLSIGDNAFNYCYCITEITIPSTVTSIGERAFGNCTGMKAYYLKPTTPPTLANTNAFTGITSDCKIYVPQGSLSAYQTATNWSAYASYMEEEPTT